MENNKKILEEIRRINFLTNYDTKKVISEQRVLDITDNLLTEGAEKKRRGFSLGTEFGDKEFNFRGKQRDPGRMSLDFSYEKQLDKGLDTVGDVLGKMNSELNGDEEFKKLPSETKIMLATGFYNAITLLIDGQNLPKEDKEGLRKIKKFFKKSQKWKFEIVAPAEEEISTVNIKVKSKGDITSLESLNTLMSTEISSLNASNSNEGVILSRSASYFSYDSKLGDVSSLPLQKSVMSTLFARASKPLKTTELSPEKIENNRVELNVVMPRIPGKYAKGSSDPGEFFKGLMSSILNEIYKSEVTIGGETKTVKEMIDCGTENCESQYTINVTNATIVSSASNTWTTEVLDFTHKNSGDKIKDITEISPSGKNPNNLKLAKNRANNLIQLVMLDLGKTPGLKLSTNWTDSVTMETRVTDTGGKVDELRDKTTYPNPGQYSEISIGFTIIRSKDKRVSASNQLSGTISQRFITLRYVGGEGADINLNLSIEPPTKTKSLYLKKGIFGDQHLSSGETRRRMNQQQNKRDRSFERNRRNN
jgi:hypothetical protein